MLRARLGKVHHGSDKFLTAKPVTEPKTGTHVTKISAHFPINIIDLFKGQKAFTPKTGTNWIWG